MICVVCGTGVGGGLCVNSSIAWSNVDLQVLDTLVERMEPGRLLETLREIRSDVKGGGALSDAFGRFPAMFPQLYVASLRAGEQVRAQIERRGRDIPVREHLGIHSFGINGFVRGEDGTLQGAGGADLLEGGDGSDALDGGSGDDTLVGGDVRLDT